MFSSFSPFPLIIGKDTPNETIWGALEKENVLNEKDYLSKPYDTEQ